MGGKNYYCDYCCCFMKNDYNIRNVHKTGLAHKIAKATYIRRFEDPRTILFNESLKVPCTRYPKGFCRFDLFCQYSHYNEKQLMEMRRIVYKLEQKAKAKIQPDGDKKTEQLKQYFPLQVAANVGVCQQKKYKRIPPSLRINFNKLHKADCQLSWG